MAKNDERGRKAAEFARSVERKSKRRERSKKGRKRFNPWWGLSMFGMIGWSVSIPTLIGLALGIWLDRRYEGGISWTLTLLVAGVIVGCAIAWHWLRREGGRIAEYGVQDQDKDMER